MTERWYKNALIYCLDVETYKDSTGNGIGDFQGLSEKLNYIANLGANCIWLLPFYPSPNRDNGYDVMDYYGVDPRLGTLGDFVQFMRLAEERGLRVIVDLVINHTSIEHPWFQQARKDENSKYRDFYVWSEEKPEDADQGMIFPGQQETTWTYDRAAGEYYYHRFYEHQPELNISNPKVREEMRKIMGFWLELGVSGFRLDAAPFLIELKGIDDPDVDNPYGYLSEFRDYLSWRRGDAILLAEANVAPEKVDEYFANGTRMHMLFNFLLNQNLFLALEREKASPLVESMQETPAIPATGQWANFLRNHDELDLGRLSDQERQQVFQKFAPEEDMRLFDRGIRRRLPPMLAGNWPKIEMAYSLMLSLPGSPILRYGEEIGMGEDLSLSGRTAVRTPMQWSNEKNAGFSSAEAEDLIRPVVEGGQYGYEQINVADQQSDRDSLLNRIELMLRARRNAPELGNGTCRVLEVENESVLAHSCSWRGGRFVALHNLSGGSQQVKLTALELEPQKFINLLGREAMEISGERLTLRPYGYQWLRSKSQVA
ncbi:MAG: alpha-amylase family protein [Anaerolineales bacterium]